MNRLRPHPAVLVVEDDPLTRLDISLALSDAGFAVIEVGDGDSALEILETRQKVDVVFTDVEMPGQLDGLDLTRIIARRWPDLPVLVTSGHSSAEGFRKDRFFAKPYDPAQVISKARRLAAAPLKVH